jgi:hypothetical protein
MPTVRDVRTDNLHVSVTFKANVPMVRDLRDVLEAVLQSRPQSEFSRDEVDAISVTAAGCPPGTESACDFQGNRTLRIFATPLEAVVKREELDELNHALDRYVLSSDQDLLRFRIHQYRSYQLADWLDDRTWWKSDESFLHSQIDMALDAHMSLEPPAFRLMKCSDLPDLLATFGTIRDN